jgi:hypothetical protein
VPFDIDKKIAVGFRNYAEANYKITVNQMLNIPKLQMYTYMIKLQMYIMTLKIVYLMLHYRLEQTILNMRLPLRTAL